MAAPSAFVLRTGSVLGTAAQDLADSPPPQEPGQNLYEAACATWDYRSAGKMPFISRGLLGDGSAEVDATHPFLRCHLRMTKAGCLPFGPVLTDADVARLVTCLPITPQALLPAIASR